MPAVACRYASYYLTRNSLTYTAPVMVSDPTLGMDITQVRHPPQLGFYLLDKAHLICLGDYE